MIFIFSLLVVYHIYCFVNVKPSLHPRDKSHLVIKECITLCHIRRRKLPFFPNLGIKWALLEAGLVFPLASEML